VYVIKALPQCRVCSGYLIGRAEATGKDFDEGRGIEDDSVVALAPCPLDQGRTLLIGYERAGLALWDVETRERLVACFGRKGRFAERQDEAGSFFRGPSFGALFKKQAARPKDGESVPSPPPLLTCATWHPDGAHAAAGYADGTFEIWLALPVHLNDRNVAKYASMAPGAPIPGGSALPLLQRVTSNGLVLPPGPVLEGGVTIADLELGDGDPAPIQSLTFVGPAHNAALVVLGGLSKPVVSLGGGRGGMGGKIEFSCVHYLLPEAQAHAACSDAACGIAPDAQARDAEGAQVGSPLRSTEDDGGPKDPSGENEASKAGRPGGPRNSFSVWGALKMATTAGHHHDSAGGQRGAQGPVGATGGTYLCVASFASADGEARSLATAVLPPQPGTATASSLGNRLQFDNEAARGSPSSKGAPTNPPARRSIGLPTGLPTAGSLEIFLALVGVRGRLDLARWSTCDLTPRGIALPGPLVSGGFGSGGAARCDAVVTLAAQAGVPAPVWTRLVAANRGLGVPQPPHEKVPLRVLEAPASLLRLGSWQRRDGGGLADRFGLPTWVSAAFTVLAVARGDGTVTVCALGCDSCREKENGGEGHNAAAFSDKGDSCGDAEKDGAGAENKVPGARRILPCIFALAHLDLADFDELPAGEARSERAASRPAVTAVALCMELGVVCVALGGEHSCAGQVCVLQLTKPGPGGGADGRAGTSRQRRVHGGGRYGGPAISEPEEKVVVRASAAPSIPASGDVASGRPGARSRGSGDPFEIDGDGSGSDLDSLEDEIEAAVRAASLAHRSPLHTEPPLKDGPTAGPFDADTSSVPAAAQIAAREGCHAAIPNSISASGAKEPEGEGQGRDGAQGGWPRGADQPNRSSSGGRGGPAEEWAWTRVFTVTGAHLVAARCLACAVDGEADGGLLVAAADGAGVLSLTQTRTGLTRTVAGGTSRGGVVRAADASASGDSHKATGAVRDQRVVRLAFAGPRRVLGGGHGSGNLGGVDGSAQMGGPSLVLVSLACGEVHVVEVNTAQVIIILPAPGPPDPLLATATATNGGINLAPAAATACPLAEVLQAESKERHVLIVAGRSVRLHGLPRGGAHSNGGPLKPRGHIPAVTAVSCVQMLGPSPVLGAALLDRNVVTGGKGGGGKVLVLCLCADWVAWLLSVDQQSGKLKVEGVRQVDPPGGAPPWDFEEGSGRATAAAPLVSAYDERVTAQGGGGFQVGTKHVVVLSLYLGDGDCVAEKSSPVWPLGSLVKQG